MNNVKIHNISQFNEIDSSNFDVDIAFAYYASDKRSLDCLDSLNKDVTAVLYVDQITLETCNDEIVFKTFREKMTLIETRCWNENKESDLIINMIQVLTTQLGRDVKIFIDTSAMPRTVMSSLISIMRKCVEEIGSINCILGYSLAKYTNPSELTAPPNKRVAPVHTEYAGWHASHGLPVKLIVGLGYENGKALGAVEYIQPAILQLFLPVSPEQKFREEVEKKNHQLIEMTNSSNVFYYDVLDAFGQYHTLSSMLSQDIQVSKPVLLPFGPKIFFGISLMCALRFPEVAVWHVSGEEEETTSPKEPSGRRVFISLSISINHKTESSSEV